MHCLYLHFVWKRYSCNLSKHCLTWQFLTKCYLENRQSKAGLFSYFTFLTFLAFLLYTVWMHLVNIHPGMPIHCTNSAASQIKQLRMFHDWLRIVISQPRPSGYARCSISEHFSVISLQRHYNLGLTPRTAATTGNVWCNGVFEAVVLFQSWDDDDRIGHPRSFHTAMQNIGILWNTPATLITLQWHRQHNYALVNINCETCHSSQEPFCSPF